MVLWILFSSHLNCSQLNPEEDFQSFAKEIFEGSGRGELAGELQKDDLGYLGWFFTHSWMVDLVENP